MVKTTEPEMQRSDQRTGLQKSMEAEADNHFSPRAGGTKPAGLTHCFSTHEGVPGNKTRIIAS
jgi:hypothetical protein